MRVDVGFLLNSSPRRRALHVDIIQYATILAHARLEISFDNTLAYFTASLISYRREYRISTMISFSWFSILLLLKESIPFLFFGQTPSSRQYHLYAKIYFTIAYWYGFRIICERVTYSCDTFQDDVIFVEAMGAMRAFKTIATLLASAPSVHYFMTRRCASAGNIYPFWFFIRRIAKLFDAICSPKQAMSYVYYAYFSGSMHTHFTYMPVFHSALPSRKVSASVRAMTMGWAHKWAHLRLWWRLFSRDDEYV